MDIGIMNNLLYLTKFTAWILRFSKNCCTLPQERNMNGYLTSDEISNVTHETELQEFSKLVEPEGR